MIADPWAVLGEAAKPGVGQWSVPGSVPPRGPQVLHAVGQCSALPWSSSPPWRGQPAGL